MCLGTRWLLDQAPAEAYDNFVERLAREEVMMLARLRSADERKLAIKPKETVSPGQCEGA